MGTVDVDNTKEVMTDDTSEVLAPVIENVEKEEEEGVPKTTITEEVSTNDDNDNEIENDNDDMEKENFKEESTLENEEENDQDDPESKEESKEESKDEDTKETTTSNRWVVRACASLLLMPFVQPYTDAVVTTTPIGSGNVIDALRQ